jgi:hypothetical protein
MISEQIPQDVIAVIEDLPINDALSVLVSVMFSIIIHSFPNNQTQAQIVSNIANSLPGQFRSAKGILHNGELPN